MGSRVVLAWVGGWVQQSKLQLLGRDKPIALLTRQQPVQSHTPEQSRWRVEEEAVEKVVRRAVRLRHRAARLRRRDRGLNGSSGVGTVGVGLERNRSRL